MKRLEQYKVDFKNALSALDAAAKEAFRVGIIENQESVLKMVDDRNLTVHLYDLKTSREVFDRIRLSHRVAFRKAMERMEK